MALYIDLHINARLIETYSAQRVTNTGRRKLAPDEVSEYEVRDKFGELHGKVNHRFGDGAAVLARKALQLLEERNGRDQAAGEVPRRRGEEAEVQGPELRQEPGQ